MLLDIILELIRKVTASQEDKDRWLFKKTKTIYRI
jgi:hypothetical protein